MFALWRNSVSLLSTVLKRQSIFDLCQITQRISVDLRSLVKSIHPFAFLRCFSVEVKFDLREPHEWYPMSRSIDRKIIYHAGPTNSGKTYSALERLKKCSKGLYCAPLRLLAMEVFDTLNRDGVYCDLVTGQERKEVPGALHTSSTVEMVNLNQHYDVAVIDEIQMLNDEDRGYAWTRALLGLPANEVHLCGDPSVISLVHKLCQKTNEELEVFYYKRFTSLDVDSESIEDYKQVQSGDCIVAFSRTDIYKIKQIIEYHTDYKVCVVYGALPPEVRRQQANLFNQVENGFDVMVASDAVGMGLNLNIRRIIFHTLSKSNGESMEEISGAQIRQISGRAGRKNSIYPNGKVTCLDPLDLPATKEALASSSDPGFTTKKAGLFPEFHHIESYASQLQTRDLLVVLKAIEENSKISANYFPCRSTDPKEIAELLQTVPLSLQDQYYFCIAPLDTTNPELMVKVLEYATLYSRGLPVACRVTLPERTPLFIDDLRPLETLYQVISLWLWLSYRFGEDRFPSRMKAEKLMESVTQMFETGLRRITLPSGSRSASLEGVVSRKRAPLKLTPPVNNDVMRFDV